MEIDDHDDRRPEGRAVSNESSGPLRTSGSWDVATDVRASRRSSSAWWWLGGALASMLVVVLIAGYFVRLPYVIFSPGPVYPLDQDALSVEGATTYPSEGELLFLTISVTRQRPNVYRFLQAKFDSSSEIVRESEFFGEESSRDHLVRDVELMNQSQIAARAVALELLGYDVAIDRIGALVYGIFPEHAARGNLRLGDVVVAVDGAPTPTVLDVRAAIQSRAVGDRLVATVQRRDGPGDEPTEVDVEVTIGELDGVPFLGVQLQDYVDVAQWPVEITLDTQRVSGSSAGLAFALAVVDVLSPGDLTGGNIVAVTGTLSLDGTVGPVGGVELKAESARRAGAVLMIVPNATLEEAERGAGSMQVVGVDTIEEALAALMSIGGQVPSSTFDVDLAA